MRASTAGRLTAMRSLVTLGDVVPTQLTSREAHAVRAFVEAARALLGDDLREVRLFGSRARGDSNEDSDGADGTAGA